MPLSMMPAAVVAALCPNAKAVYVTAFAQLSYSTLLQYGITTAQRLGYFLSEAFYQTDGLQTERETGVYVAAQIVALFGVGVHSAAVTEAEAALLDRDPPATCERVYGLGNPTLARVLGNNVAGDGYFYRAGGLTQIRGRSRYRFMGGRCGVDFETTPDLIAAAEYAVKPALEDWKLKKLNNLADRDDLLAICKVIDFGDARWPHEPADMANRQAWHESVRLALD